MTEDTGDAPEVSVLVVAYASADWLDRCLRSLAEDTEVRHRREVLVLDNASPGDDRSVMRRYEVRAFTSPVNLGFGRGVNRLAAEARGRHLLLLNPDTEVRPGAVDALVDFLQAGPERVMVGGRTLTPEGELLPSSCWGTPTPWSLTCFGLGLSTAFARHPRFDPESLGSWPRDSIREVGVVTGCLALLHRDTWRRLGGFDERFYMYSEDTDLSLRAARLGRLAITPAAEAVHAVGASSRPVERAVLLHRGKTTLVRTHWSGWRRAWMLAMIRLGVALRALLERVTTDRAGAPWLATWRRRHEWVRGWPQPEPDDGIQPLL